MQNIDITLSAEQEALFNMMEESRQHLFITGRAGTGKSVLLRYFRENTKKKIIVAAPTGIAALNVRGQTIHSLFKISTELYRKGRLTPDVRLYSLLKRIDCLVVDEISMTRAEMMDAIDERFRKARNNDLPFGGVQVIMFGDVYQLPPVVPDDPIIRRHFETVYKGYFFFNAHVWQETEFKIYELSQVFRQKDPLFRDILNDVRDGSVVDSQIEALNVRHGVPVPAEGTITLAATNTLVAQINEQKLNKLPGEMHEYQATITGKMKQNTFPTEEILQLKKEAQIVMVKNDLNKRWVNGTVGKIEDVFKDHVDVNIKGVIHTLERETWEEISYKFNNETQDIESEVTSSFTQYPLRLAWAMTMHKSQGQTYDSVCLDLTRPTFAAGQLYVGLSRCTSLEGLFLTVPIKRSFIIVDTKVAEFMSRRETIKIEVIEDTSKTSVEPQETAVVVESGQIPAAKEKRLCGGRKAYAEEDKLEKISAYIDPSMAEVLDLFVDMLKASGENAKEIVLFEGRVPSKNDILKNALLNYAPFQNYFENSSAYEEYADRQARQAAAKEERKHPKRAKNK